MKPGELDYYIPPRTRCVYSVLIMQRRKDLWGPDGTSSISCCLLFVTSKTNSRSNLSCVTIAMKFDPDRFLDERVQKYLILNPFIFLPFNAGPRICLGQQVRRRLSPSKPATAHPLCAASRRRDDARCQFAYNEVSFMLVRLLQCFSTVKLCQEAHPAAMPPPGAAFSPYAVDGRERVWMRSHLTAYAKVRGCALAWGDAEIDGWSMVFFGCD